MLHQTFLAIGIALVLSVATARADISPTQYVGYGIAPVDAHGLRMVNAQVDIVWGDPCDLTATFVIQNSNATSTDIQLGFPIPHYRYYPAGNALKEIAFAFDGIPVAPDAITVSAQEENKPRYSTWFRCHHSFRPGSTKVTVKIKLPASLDGNYPYREHLYYCIETGDSWQGTIGSEEVIIHFPGPVIPEQKIETTPNNYQDQLPPSGCRFCPCTHQG